MFSLFSIINEKKKKLSHMVLCVRDAVIQYTRARSWWHFFRKKVSHVTYSRRYKNYSQKSERRHTNCTSDTLYSIYRV